MCNTCKIYILTKYQNIFRIIIIDTCGHVYVNCICSVITLADSGMCKNGAYGNIFISVQLSRIR